MFDSSGSKFKFLSQVFLSVIFLFCFFSPVRAYSVPGVFVTDLKINGVKNNIISGEFTLWNSENYYIADLNKVIKLFQGTDFYKFNLVDVNVDKNVFFIAPNQKITQQFSYQYPKNIVSGDYTLRAQTITGTGDELAWKDVVLPLTGENKFLNKVLSSAKALINGKEFLPLEGATIASGGKATGVFKITNSGDEITVVPKIRIFQREYNMQLVKEYDDNPVVFKKGETKEISLDMPDLKNPESYLAEVKLYKDNEQISGIVYFRWIVAGQGGKILHIEADKDAYKAGDNMLVTIISVGPADGSEIKNGQLEVAVYDGSGNIVVQNSKDIVLGQDVLTSVITIPVYKDLISPKIEAKLASGAVVLDQQTISLPIFSDEAKQLSQKQKIKKILLYLIPAIIILLIGGFWFFRFRNKRKQSLLKP